MPRRWSRRPIWLEDPHRDAGYPELSSWKAGRAAARCQSSKLKKGRTQAAPARSFDVDPPTRRRRTGPCRRAPPLHPAKDLLDAFADAQTDCVPDRSLRAPAPHSLGASNGNGHKRCWQCARTALVQRVGARCTTQVRRRLECSPSNCGACVRPRDTKGNHADVIPIGPTPADAHSRSLTTRRE
jgi:hypothetical protein